ncbi:MAG: hypothetical protein ABIB97_01175 [Patescibacteria group bacterium]
MEDYKSQRPKKKLGYGTYLQVLVIACLILLALFIAPWLWILIVLWAVLKLFRRFKK